MDDEEQYELSMYSEQTLQKTDAVKQADPR